MTNFEFVNKWLALMKSLSMKPFLFETPLQLLLTFGFTSGISNMTENLEIRQLESYWFYETAEETTTAWFEFRQFQMLESFEA